MDHDGISDLGYARLDTGRAARTGDPEVVYGAGKTPEQVVEILATLHSAHPDRAVLATRLTDAALDAVTATLPDVVVDDVRPGAWSPWCRPARPTRRSLRKRH